MGSQCNPSITIYLMIISDCQLILVSEDFRFTVTCNIWLNLPVYSFFLQNIFMLEEFMHNLAQICPDVDLTTLRNTLGLSPAVQLEDLVLLQDKLSFSYIQHWRVEPSFIVCIFQIEAKSTSLSAVVLGSKNDPHNLYNSFETHQYIQRNVSFLAMDDHIINR